MNYKFKRTVSLFVLFTFIFSYTPAFAWQSKCQDPTMSRNQATINAEKLVKDRCEAPFIVEHLPTYKKTSVNMVKIYQNQVTIMTNNVLKVSFSGDFNSKFAKCGDRVAFILNDGLVTEEGRVLIPCCSQILGTIQQVEKPKVMNRNAQVYLTFDEIIFPNGARLPICAKVASKNAALKNSSWKAVGKAAAYTVGLFGVGAGLGAAIGAAAGNAGLGCLAFGMPIGGGIGLILGTVTPGLHYKAKEGKVVYILLAQDLCIYQCCEQTP